MLKKIRAVLTLTTLLLVLFHRSAFAGGCANIDSAADQPLLQSSLPPKGKCAVRLRNGFPIPDPSCTPGAVNPTVALEDLSATKFLRRCHLNSKILASERAKTYEWYGINQPANNIEADKICELNGLIPLELGGADSLSNIWPLCGPPGANFKQRYFEQKGLVEAFLTNRVRAGLMDLAEAQKGIAEDWTQYLEPVWAIAGQRRTTSGVGTGSSQETDLRVVDLLVATTRGIMRIPNPTDTQLELIAAEERREPLSFGAARIRIPEDARHKIGQVERPKQWVFFGITLYREREDERKHFKLKSTRWLSQNEFIDSVKNTKSEQALIFVHGFNTPFADGLFRLAQIVWDTQFQGVPILFSWPSKGKVLAYEFDRESAEFSAPALRQLLKLLQDNTKLSTIHIIAHSMGNLVALQALADSSLSGKSFGQLLLAAPDVDRDLFEVLGPKIAEFRGITLYASAADKALALSHKIAQGRRAGDIPSPPDLPVLLPKMDTIDVTAIGSELFGLNHNTFASSRSAIDDIGRLLRTGERPPNLRTPQIRRVPLSDQRTLWKYVY